MKKSEVTLESLDTRINGVDMKLENLDKKIDVSIEKLDKKIDHVDVRFDELMEFLNEHIMMREDVVRLVDDKMTEYKSDQFEFQDRVGKQSETNTNENLMMRHEIDVLNMKMSTVEKHLGI